MKPRRLRSLLVLALLVPVTAGATTIRGTLRSGRGPAIKAASATRPKLPPAWDPVREAVIYLEEVPEKVEKKLAKKAESPTIGQFDKRFIPRVTPVAAGTKVRFENQDRIYQNAFSVSAAKKFNVGQYGPRESREVTFDKPGVVKLYNVLEPSMAGFVLVLPHHAFVRPDSMGAWSFPKLPKGKYRVKVWHPTMGSISRRVETPRKGDAILELSY